MALTNPQRRAVLFLLGNPGSTAREVAQGLWPESPAWQRRTHKRLGRNGAMGGTMPMNAAKLLHRVEASGLIERRDNRWYVREQARRG